MATCTACGIAGEWIVSFTFRKTTYHYCDECEETNIGYCNECGARTAIVAGACRLGGASDSEFLCPEHRHLASQCVHCYEYNYSDSMENRWCENCANNRSRSMHVQILSPGDKPSLKPIGKGPIFKSGFERFYLGVELECEVDGNRDQMAQKIWPYLSEFCILKNDGSLCNGFEICSSPASLDMHRTLWAPFFKHIPQGLKSWSRKSCGMHVHCTRKALTPMQLGKAVLFINAKENKTFVQQIAGRHSTYATFDHQKTVTSINGNNRYEALNMSNSTTVEYRIFRGTLNFDRFMKNLEFACALMDFSRPCHSTLKQAVSIERFMEFMREEKKKYPALHSFLVDNKLGKGESCVWR